MRKLISLVLILLTPLMVFAARPKVALVLSGGGARGISQIPIIKELESRGIYPDIVTGTSIGALIGGLYSSGYSALEIEEIVKQEDLSDIIFNLQIEEQNLDRPYSNYDRSLISLSISEHGIGLNNSLLDDSKVEALIKRKLSKVLDVKSFDDLSIPFRCVGTDFVTGEAIIFSTNLYDSLRSSMSLPLVFSPNQLEDGRYVVDGGLADNLPASIARELGADIIIAIDVNDSVRANATEPYYLETLSGVAKQLIILISMGSVRSEHQLSDYLMIPDTGDISVIDFTSVDEILQVGEAFVSENKALFDQIEEELKGYLPLEKPLAYDERPHLYIDEIQLPTLLKKYEKLFIPFKERVFDEAYIAELSTVLSKLKQRENFKSISYNVSDGILAIDVKRYEERILNATIGLSADFSFRNDYLFFDPGVTLTSSYYIKGSKLTGKLRIGSINLLAFEYSYPLDKMLDLSFALEGGFGAYARDSLISVKNHKPSQGGSISLLTTFTSNFTKNERLDITIKGELTKIDLFSSTPSIWYFGSGISYSSRSNIHSIDLLLQAGFDGGFCYEMKGDTTLNLDRFILSFKLRAIRGNESLASSYDVDLFSTLAKDRLSAELSYKLFTNKYWNLSVGCFFDLNDCGNTTSLIPFAALSDIMLGPKLSLDIKLLDTIDVSFIAALSNDKKLSIGMYVR